MESCPAQLTERIINLASRKAFDIEHLGDQSAIALTNPGGEPAGFAGYVRSEHHRDSRQARRGAGAVRARGGTAAAGTAEASAVQRGGVVHIDAATSGMCAWREAAIIEIHEIGHGHGKIKRTRKRIGGSGLWHQVPAFWTAPTPARRSFPRDGRLRQVRRPTLRLSRIRDMTCRTTPWSCASIGRPHATARSTSPCTSARREHAQDVRRDGQGPACRPVAGAGRLVDTSSRPAHGPSDCLRLRLAGGHRAGGRGRAVGH